MHEISKNRIRLHSLLKKFYKENKNPELLNLINDIKKNKNNHFLSFNKEGKITYAKNIEDKYIESKRINTTIGRYTRRHLKNKNLDDDTLSKLNDFLIRNVCNLFDFELLSGKDLLIAYKNFKYPADSCMTGVKNQSKIQFYADNPNKVFLLTNKNKDTRALVFIADDGTKVLNRVYGKNTNKLLAYAKKNNIIPFVLSKCSKKITLKYKKKIFPSVDNFCYAQLDSELKNINESGKIILSNNPNFGNAILASLYGSFILKPKCNICKKTAKENHIYCNKCLKKHFFNCSCCRINIKKNNKNYRIIKISDNFKLILCKFCYRNSFNKDYYCNNCKKYISLIEKITYCNRVYCLNCVNKLFFK
jgi:hypothetical protein